MDLYKILVSQRAASRHSANCEIFYHEITDMYCKKIQPDKTIFCILLYQHTNEF